LHSSVLRLCFLEPYVPLRNATKRKRLRFGNICRNHLISYGWGVINELFPMLFIIWSSSIYKISFYVY